MLLGLKGRACRNEISFWKSVSLQALGTERFQNNAEQGLRQKYMQHETRNAEKMMASSAAKELPSDPT